jgi:hypothetical protein
MSSLWLNSLFLFGFFDFPESKEDATYAGQIDCGSLRISISRISVRCFSPSS